MLYLLSCSEEFDPKDIRVMPLDSERHHLLNDSC